jgi:Family of unknown function (DUF6557)
MNLREIIQPISWLELKPLYMELYPDNAESIEVYERIFSNLKHLSPGDSNLEIAIEFENDPDGPYYDVSGVETAESGSEERTTWALDFVDWSDWLDMQIEPVTLSNYRPIEIVAHCLWEMTFMGFSVEEIRTKRAALERRVDEIRAQHRLDN